MYEPQSARLRNAITPIRALQHEAPPALRVAIEYAVERVLTVAQELDVEARPASAPPGSEQEPRVIGAVRPAPGE